MSRLSVELIKCKISFWHESCFLSLINCETNSSYLIFTILMPRFISNLHVLFFKTNAEDLFGFSLFIKQSYTILLCCVKKKCWVAYYFSSAVATCVHNHYFLPLRKSWQQYNLRQHCVLAAKWNKWILNIIWDSNISVHTTYSSSSELQTNVIGAWRP